LAYILGTGSINLKSIIDQSEWAQSVDDILWRRSKLGLKFGKADMTLLDDYLQSVLGHQHSKIA
jgi:glycerol-3-phosphate dehydrogenase